jgi:hypothetical protein
MQRGPWIVAIIGVVFLLLSLTGLFISLAIPIVNAPHASWDEALLGIIPSGGCSCFSLMIVLAGVVWLLVARAKH